MKQIESIREWGGYLNRYTHNSDCCQCEMTFSVFLPEEAESGKVPALYFLSGLTCTDDNFRTKAGAQRYAAEHGIALIIPDTSPRGDDVPDEPERYDLGKGAGFYVNATQAPWSSHYQMYDYIVSELPALLASEFPIDTANSSITGHSMGGHGALVIALKNPGKYRSVSAFAPIANPSVVGWGHGCFGNYLGDDKSLWESYDATCLINSGQPLPPTLIDQGTADEFFEEQLKTGNLEQAVKNTSVDATIRYQEGYDHSYHFIGTFFGEHMAFHAKHLRG